MDRRPVVKLIVIHGRGGHYAQAVDMLDRLGKVRPLWDKEQFFLPQREGLVLRRLLSDEPQAPVLASLQKLAVARMLRACFLEPGQDTKGMITISESRLLSDYTHLGIPLGPEARQQRSQQLQLEALEDLGQVEKGLRRLKDELEPRHGAYPTERQARQLVLGQSYGKFTPEQMLTTLNALRAMPETGGDLDTVASCTFYIYALRARAKAKGEPFEHGRHWRIVFVNYHESFEHLAEHAPAEVYMADLPIGALPDFQGQVERLAEQDVRFRTYEDHHPYTREQIEMLRGLTERGLIKTLRMSGPLQGEEQEEEDQKCAADMVYERLIKDRPHDCPGMSELRDAAHSEDLVTDRGPLGRSLTELIKNGVNKVELAQQLSQCHEEGGVQRMLESHGWKDEVDKAREGFEQATPRLWDNVLMISFQRKPGSEADQGGPPIHPGSDMPNTKAAPERKQRFNVLIAQAPPPKPGAVKINVGKATEHFAKEVPDADYLFYCYGARLLVSRRLNQADLALNLGELMPLIGGPGDGGHAGAAVCRPEANEAFPKRMIPNVRGGNFSAFARYLADRIQAHTGHHFAGRRNLSKPEEQGNRFSQGSVGILVLSAVALVVGTVLLFVFPGMSRQEIVQSNADFFSQVPVRQADDQPEADPGAEPEAEAEPQQGETQETNLNW